MDRQTDWQQWLLSCYCSWKFNHNKPWNIVSTGGAYKLKFDHWYNCIKNTNLTESKKTLDQFKITPQWWAHSYKLNHNHWNSCKKQLRGGLTNTNCWNNLCKTSYLCGLPGVTESVGASTATPCIQTVPPRWVSPRHHQQQTSLCVNRTKNQDGYHHHVDPLPPLRQDNKTVQYQ